MGKKFDSSALMERVDRAAVSPEQIVQTARDIETITAEILTLKQDAGNAIIGIGQRLIEAKEVLPHGAWLPWLEERVEFSERSAQYLMKLSKEWSNPQTIADLGAAKAFALLALPPGERETFMAENHVVNGEEKTVIDMTARELKQAIRDRDAARLEAEAAKADAKTAEESCAKMEADIAALKSSCEAFRASAASAHNALESAKKKLNELRNKPVDVAVMAVDQEKLDQARADAVAEMQAKVDKAKAARDKAEEKRKAAESALAEANARLEEAAKAEKESVISSDGDLSAFKALWGQAKDIANKLNGFLIKANGREDRSQAEGMRKSMIALADAIRKAAEV